jgi:four helix bundle protein
MASFKRFEDIQGWQKARELVQLVYRRVQKADEQRDWNFAKQFTSAALSVMNNIAEGFGRLGDKEFVRFLIIARGSAVEVQSMTYTAEDLAYITPDERVELYDLAGEALKLIGGLIRFLESNAEHS